MCSITSGSSITAKKRISPPQWGQGVYRTAQCRFPWRVYIVAGNPQPGHRVRAFAELRWSTGPTLSTHPSRSAAPRRLEHTESNRRVGVCLPWRSDRAITTPGPDILVRSFAGRTVLAHPPGVANQVHAALGHMLEQRLQPLGRRHDLNNSSGMNLRASLQG